MENVHIIGVLLLTLFFSAYLAENVVAQDGEPGWEEGAIALEDYWKGVKGNWQMIGIIAIMVCFMFDVIILMVGYGFQLESVKRWATKELMNVVASAIMILLLVQLVDGALTIAMNDVIGKDSTITCGGVIYGGYANPINPVTFVQCRMGEKIKELDALYKNIFEKNRLNEATRSIIIYIAGFPVYYGWQIDKVYEKVEKAHFLGEQIVPLLVSLHGQYVLMSYIAKNMLTFFLPIGIILRVFPPTRGIGGLFIATAIGFYIIFPTMYVINDPSYVKAPPAPEEPIEEMKECYTGFRGVTALVSSFETKEAKEISLSYEEAGARIASITVDIMFFPFIALAATLMFISATTPILGGDTGEMLRMVAKVT